jgi:O-antigen/teichoic acid export membrane protein
MQSDTVIRETGDIKESPLRASRIGGARKGFLGNVASNIVLMVIQAGVSLWFTPYLIDHLGIAAYGMVPLANSVTSYMQVLIASYSAAVGRFLTIDLERADRLTANSTFNTALFGVIGIVAALIPVALVISLAFPYVFDVPSGWEEDASWLFAAVAVAFFVTGITGSFAVSSYAYSKFWVRNLVRLIALSARIGLVVTLFSMFSARLWHVGGGVLVASLVAFVGNILLWRKLTPELCVRVTAFDRSRLRSLMGTGGWVLVNRVGAMLLSRVDLIVVNAFFGAAMTGRYGSMMQFSILINSSASVATDVISPVIVRRFARGDFVGLRHLCSQAVKLLGLALALPVGLLCGFSRPFLSLWLGPSFQDMGVLLVFLIGHLGVNLSALPMRYVHRAYNKIHWPGMVTLLSGMTNLGLAILLAKWGGWGVVGVAVAGAVVWTAQNVLYIPIYTARIMELPWWAFLPSLTAGLAGTLSVGMAAYGLTLVRMPTDWFALAASAAIVSLLYAVGVGGLGLRRADWQFLSSLLPWQMK